MKPLKLYWSSGLKDGRRNFGDWLSPLLCEKLSGRQVEYARPNRCDLIAIGSILHRLGNAWYNRRVHIWGTGLIEEVSPFTGRHYYHALRGRKTDACIRHASKPVFGDPALLCDMLLDDSPRKKDFPVGVIPHYKDQDDPIVKGFLSRNPYATMVDVFSEPHEFIRKIGSCQVVLSSSLHGLVVADSLAVPNAWIRPSNLVRGNDFKFQDYYSAFGLEAQAFILDGNTSLAEVLEIATLYRRNGIEEIKKNLLDAFPFRP